MQKLILSTINVILSLADLAVIQVKVRSVSRIDHPDHFCLHLHVFELQVKCLWTNKTKNIQGRLTMKRDTLHGVQ